MEKYALSGLLIPSACAVRTIALGPTRSVNCAKTELSDDTMPVATLTRPR